MADARSSLAILPYLLPGFDEPYITMNGTPHYGPVHAALAGESLYDHEYIQNHLRQQEPCGAYIGFGGWINLGYIAALQPSFSVLADINALQALYWQLHLNTVAACETPEKFATAIPDIVADVSRFACTLPGGMNGYLTKENRGEICYGAFRDDLSVWRHETCDGYALSDKAYESLRQIVLEDRIAVAVFDIKDESKVQALRQIVEVKKPPMSHTVVHLSNLLDFIKGNSEDWAGTDCDKYALLHAKRHSKVLAHGCDNIETGAIIFTRAQTFENDVRYTTTGDIDLFAFSGGSTIGNVPARGLNRDRNVKHTALSLG